VQSVKDLRMTPLALVPPTEVHELAYKETSYVVPPLGDGDMKGQK